MNGVKWYEVTTRVWGLKERKCEVLTMPGQAKTIMAPMVRIPYYKV